MAQIQNAHKVRKVLTQGWTGEVDVYVGFSLNRGIEAPNNNLMYVYWQDVKGQEYFYTINETGLDNTTIVNESLVMNNVEGTEITLKLYRKPTPITPIINW